MICGSTQNSGAREFSRVNAWILKYRACKLGNAGVCPLLRPNALGFERDLFSPRHMIAASGLSGAPCACLHYLAMPEEPGCSLFGRAGAHTDSHCPDHGSFPQEGQGGLQVQPRQGNAEGAGEIVNEQRGSRVMT